MTYQVDAARSRVRKQLRRIPKSDLERIVRAVQALAENPYPSGVVQLEKDIYRIRVGNYRVIYKVFEDEKLVLIGRIARRNEGTYRSLRDLFS